MPDPAVARSWDIEYQAGRYLDERPVSFVEDIRQAVAARGLGASTGLYIGCGNGRNFLPLVAGGLDIVGLDVSATALAQLAQRAPERRSRLVCGDLSALPPGACYSFVIAIQVMQHGNEETTHHEMKRALERVAPGGLFCLRVNAVGTELEHPHRIVERGIDGRFTVRYSAGPKSGLDIHFFSGPELLELLDDEFAPVLPLRRSVTRRTPPKQGEWVQWEGIWSRESSRARPPTG